MRRVHDARAEAAARGEIARRDILTRHDPKTAGAAITRRLDEIRAAHRTAGSPPDSPTDPMSKMTQSASHSSDQVLAALERATSLLTPTPSVAPGRRFRRSLLMAQDFLFRTLRPFWFQQRQAQTLLVDSIRHLTAASAASARHQQDQRAAMAGVWTAIHSLENTSDHDRVAELEARAGALAAEVQRLNMELAAARAGAAELSERLYPRPYMQNPAEFQDVDENGQPRPGYRRGTGAADLYLGFENIFRGSELLIRDRFRRYLPLLSRHDHVVDIGSGRGELLDLLREANIRATGVDVDEGMVRSSRGKGHTVEHTDALSYLRAQEDGSLSAIVAAQLVEHLTYEDLLEFIRLSGARLKAGGQLIFETVNPHALEAYKTFWVDLTHQRPIFPEVALAWCRLLGFEEAYVWYPNGAGDLERDRRNTGEYAVVATRVPH